MNLHGTTERGWCSHDLQNWLCGRCSTRPRLGTCSAQVKV